MTASRWLLAGLLLGLGLLSWWLSREQVLPSQADAGHLPDYYAENLVLIEMNEQGRPRQRLTSRRMEHFAGDDSLHLSQPQVLLLEEQGPPWQLRADQGWLAGQRDELWLRGQVFIDREATQTGPAYHLVTRDLHLTQDPDYAETEQSVYLLSGQDQLQGLGMQAWFEPEPRIKLLSQVRGRFEQQP
jgi:lipopolysaccharide export system protein LptC